MKKTEPDFMQRYWDCKRLILTYDKRDPDRCKRCFNAPRPVVHVATVTYNFEIKTPEPYGWK